MGFCLSCGELASERRCPRCKGKVSGASAVGFSVKDTWTASYKERPTSTQTHRPHIEKLMDKKTYDVFYQANSPTSSTKVARSVSDSVTKNYSKPTTYSETMVNSRTIRERCGKCQFLLSLNPEESIHFDSKKYHKDCISCSICSISITDFAFDLNGQASCKTCFATGNNSSESTSNLISQLKQSNPKSKPMHEKSISLPTNRISQSTIERTDSENEETPTTPTYSKTFQKLQATVNNQSNASIRVNKNKSVDGNSGLSFADLLASRRGQENRTPIRRPTSIYSGDPIIKKFSLPSPIKDSFMEKQRSVPTPLIRIDSSSPARSRASSNASRTSLLAPSELISPTRYNNEPLDRNSVSEPSPIKTEDYGSEPESEPILSDAIQETMDPSKLSCHKCVNPIGDTWFKLPDGRILHKECFECHHCTKIIEDGKYSVYEDHEYHTDCLLQLPTSPMSDASADPEDFCDRCSITINGPCFTLTNGRQYHPNCFICAGCRKRFEQGTYVSQGDKEYHKECVPKRESINCAKCSKSIKGVFVTNNNTNYHSECFRCMGCQKVITPSTPFGEVSQQPYCEPCLIQQRSIRQSSFAVSAARQEQRRTTTYS